jgi:nucleolar protein 56
VFRYGLIYHSTFIGRAATKNKGRISRYLANKCAIAARVDSFIEEPTTKYGEAMREQVEERLAFYDSGKAPKKNIDVMTAVAKSLAEDGAGATAESKSKKDKKKKRDRDEEEPVEEQKKAKKEKKEKKEKKSKKE